MRFAPNQLVFIVLFLISIAALQVGYWMERKIIRRLRTLAPDDWQKYTHRFGGVLRTGKLKRRIAMGGLGDAELAALLKTLGRMNTVAIVAFLGCVLLMAVYQIGR